MRLGSSECTCGPLHCGRSCTLTMDTIVHVVVYGFCKTVRTELHEHDMSTLDDNRQTARAGVSAV